MIRKMKDHYIVCGYGRVGRSAVATLSDGNEPVVVIESDGDLADEIAEAGLSVVQGDATNDDVLSLAGVERAKGIVICSGNDSNNLFIVLSARTMNPGILIVARAANAANEPKMRRAGADRVVSPYKLGGRHMANILLRPHVTEFLDVLTLEGGLELWLEELAIESDSPLAGLTVVEADLRKKTGVTLVALLRKATGAMLRPDQHTRMEAGDQLIVLGTRQQLDSLEREIGANV